MESNRFLDELISRYPDLVDIGDEIRQAARCLIHCYLNGHKVLVCGNGGSAADSDHIVGELMKSFGQRRPVPESLKGRLMEEWG
jgi:D-sedoheptulose 7-phosphate isomerase